MRAFDADFECPPTVLALWRTEYVERVYFAFFAVAAAWALVLASERGS